MNSRSIWTKLDRYPPIVCRMLAVENGQLVDDSVLAERTGMSEGWVKYVGSFSRWDDLPVSHMKLFVTACGVDFSDRNTMRRLNRYLKNPKFAAAQRSPKWAELKKALEAML